jgi:hypothetical protein
MNNDSPEELARLQQQTRDAVRERLKIESQLANPAALRAATARAYRDRDAVTNPELEERRQQIAAVTKELQSRWHGIDRRARDMERVAKFLDSAPKHIEEHNEAFLAQMPAVLQGRAQIAARLEQAKLSAILPTENDGGR